jgi:MoaA/NifB/PqqE/SkfB family radical SAM enzyme
MCGACDYSPGDHGMLSPEEWRAVIDSAARLHTQILSITGGEAMLRRDVYDLIQYARGLGMAVHLNSNGLLMTDKNIDQLREAGVNTVSISLESADPAIHDAIRGEGTFAKTLEGIRNLRRRAPEIRVGLNCVINKLNYQSLDKMVTLAESEQVQQLKLAPIHTNLQHKDKDVSEYEDMIFRETDIASLDAELERVQAALAQGSIQTTSRKFFEGMTKLYEAPASNFYCYAGYAIAVIDAQGNVAGCFDKASRLNVRDTPLDKLWRSRAFQEHRQLVRHCDRACWDTTNAELSLRMSVRTMLREPRQTWRDLKFYFSEKQH